MKRNIFKGFTLVELIIVITILAILSSIGFVSFGVYTKNSRDSSRLASIKNISSALSLYEIKTSKYPEPDEAITLTGNSNISIKQGKIGNNLSPLIGLINIYKDPKSGENLNYSTTSDGKYYQIGTNLENDSLSYFGNKAFADNLLVKLEGNYKFDPVLPSLFTVNGSVTSSGIFNQNVCFIDEKGNNNFNSTSSNCLKKIDLNLKNIDNSLIGYWDMETTFNSGGNNYLKDLSGNGNNGIFTGTVLPTSTGGYLGQGYYFGSGGTYGSFFLIPNSNSLNASTQNKQFTLTSIFMLTDDALSSSFTNFILKGLDIVNNDCVVSGCTNRQLGMYVKNTGNIQGIVVSKKSYENNLSQNSITSKDNYINVNKYYIVTLVGDFNTSSLSIYLNGIKHATTSLDDSGVNYNTGDLLIGNFKSRWTPPTYGRKYIDDLKIYNRALSDGEIVQQAKIAGF